VAKTPQKGIQSSPNSHQIDSRGGINPGKSRPWGDIRAGRHVAGKAPLPKALWSKHNSSDEAVKTPSNVLFWLFFSGKMTVPR
jgi:hypothetical protein